MFATAQSSPPRPVHASSAPRARPTPPPNTSTPELEAPPTSTLFGPLVPDPLPVEPWPPRGAPQRPWAPGLAALDLSPFELAELKARCDAWLAQLHSPEAQLDLWSRLVAHQPGSRHTEVLAMAILDEWLLTDAPWPGEPAPLLALAEAAAAEGQPGVAAGLRAMAEAPFEVFIVVGLGPGNRIQVRQFRPGTAWPETLTLPWPTARAFRPKVGEGLCGRLWPDAHGRLQLSEGWLPFPEPPAGSCPDRRLKAPSMLDVWLMVFGEGIDALARRQAPPRTRAKRPRSAAAVRRVSGQRRRAFGRRAA